MPERPLEPKALSAPPKTIVKHGWNHLGASAGDLVAIPSVASASRGRLVVFVESVGATYVNDCVWQRFLQAAFVL